MLLIAALGNPGKKYESTKHNFGYWVADKLAEQNSISFRSGKGKYIFAQISGKMILVKPVTYMNESGIAVADAIRYFDVPLENMLVAYDDIDLPLGSIRFRQKGGTGGHRGVESIIYHLRSENFNRLKLGIATEGHMRPAEKYVLRPFHKSHNESIASVVDTACEAISHLIDNGLEATMNKYNQKG